MKYKVIQTLEIRTEPSTSSGNTVGELKPGFVFDAVEEVNGEWLKDGMGFIIREEEWS